MHNAVRRVLLQRLADAVPDGIDALATHLESSSKDVRLWIKGLKPIPDAVFLKAVDLHAMRTLPQMLSSCRVRAK